MTLTLELEVILYLITSFFIRSENLVCYFGSMPSYKENRCLCIPNLCKKVCPKSCSVIEFSVFLCVCLFVCLFVLIKFSNFFLQYKAAAVRAVISISYGSKEGVHGSLLVHQYIVT